MSLIVEMNSDAIPILREIKRLTGIESYEEILNRALTMMYWAIQQEHSGRLVVSLNEATGDYEALKILEPSGTAATLDFQAAAG